MLDSIKHYVKLLRIRQLVELERRKRADLPSRFDGLPPDVWDLSITGNGHLACGEIDLVEVARRYGTPLHVINRARLIKDYSAFVGAFRRHLPKVELATSYKTNPLPAVLSELHRAGTWAEVISPFELWLALELKVPPDKIVLNGPGKGRESVDLAVRRGIGLINIDGPDEIPWVVESAQRWGRQQRVGLRVVTSVGWSSQFGTRIDAGESLAAFAQISRHPELLPCGIHVHLGTGIKNVDAYVRAIKEILEFSRVLQTQLGIRITCYDFGGGFAVPTVRSMDEWDGRMVSLGYPARMPIPADCPGPADYAAPIARLIREFYPGPDETMPQLLFEPGRAITSSAQTLLLSVLTVKRPASGLPKLILDGGKNITMPLEWETHQLLAANKLNEVDVEAYDIFGPLCHPGDIVMRNKLLPQMRPGDVISIMDAGAYFVPNQMNFSFPRPSAIMLDGASIREIRSRETFADIVRLDVLDLVDGSV